MNNIKRRDFLKTLGLGGAAIALSGYGLSVGKLQKHQKPNILFIMADDLGKEWISCYGAEGIATPNIDKLAAGGMRFENVYCMPQCTPTRATLLTGQYPYNNGWVNHWDVPRWGAGCHFDWNHNTTFAKVMKTAGYKTAAAGKWQINDFRVTPDAMEKHGFDDWCMWTGYETGVEASAKRYWDAYINTREGSKTYEGQFGEDVFTDFLIDFMKKNKDEPMMMYYPMALPHPPLTATPDEPGVKGKKETMAAMVRYVDSLVGKLVSAIDELGIRENTIIIWTTDNGTTKNFRNKMNGREVRGGKATTMESGVNIPFIVNAPGIVPADIVSDALSDFTDLLPTFAELGGAELPENWQLDGKSIASHLVGRSNDSDREWIMAMGGDPAKLTDKGVESMFEYRDRVIRDKQYKLFVGKDRQPEKLIDLHADPGEKNNLLSSADVNVIAAKDKLMAVAASFPEKDASPKYDSTPAQLWDQTPKSMNDFIKAFNDRRTKNKF